MGLRKILTDKDPALHKVCKPVTAFDAKLHKLLDDMGETMQDANGVGLAAPQVGILRRVVTVDLGDEILELVNPSLVETDGEQVGAEGCLSVPGKYGLVKRPFYAKVKAQDRFGEWFEVEGEEIIARCVQWKRDVVMEDEFDTGSRRKLNLGHTIGHSIEAKSNYQLSHGQAVSIGMAIVSKAAVQKGLCNSSCCRQILEILHHFGLPTDTQYSAEDLLDAMLSDKKRTGDQIHLIIPREIGNCEILPIPVSELKSFMEAGLHYGS
jgi:peptide deformylase